MAPPTELLNLDVEAISGILGSVSIACWVVVFSPQIIENFRRSSADGLSIQFIIIWLTGDVFNILGAVLQGVLPTMLILAIYYTIADVVLLAQCFYYRGFTWRDEVVPTIAIDSDDSEAASERDMGSRRGKNKGKGGADGSRGTSSDEGRRRVGEDLESGPDERTALLGGARERGNAAGMSSSSASTITSTTLTPHHHHNNGHPGHGHHLRVGGGGDLYPYDGTGEGRRSSWSHLSPAVPLVDDADLEAEILQQPRGRNGNNRARPAAAGPTKLQSSLFNLMAILMVCAAGVMGWFLSREYYPQQPSYEPPPPSSDPQDGGLPKTGVEFSFWGQIYGYLSAILYLGSRLPQLLLNFRRKSTEGVSMLFFLFACLGNLTYVLSILAYDGSSECAAGPGDCEDGEPGQIYWRYVLINMSWLAGSAGTLLLDAAIFIQFFLYSNEEVWSDDEDDSAWDSESGSGSDGCSVISERSGTVSEDGQAGVEQGQESDGRGWDSDDERSKLDEAEMRDRRRRAERDAGVKGGAPVGAGGSESGKL
ncbi:PQ loop repeat-domain-containing protein [Neurospora crassa]|nr:PQ loop repeat-domain-containing protein [Neurospora crassa]